MSESFILFHSTEHAKLEGHLASADWSMATCLRSLALFSSHRVPEELLLAGSDPFLEIYEDEKAYGFILEVICGLHSPIIGETEVMGQFKGSLQNLNAESQAHGFLKSLLTDAKKIRTEHLSGLGSQSYGSLCRRELQGMKSVHLLGAGKLTKDLLPWFLEFPKVEIYCRSILKGESLKDAYPKVLVMPWTAPGDEGDTDLESSLVIAAPISDEDLKSWLKVHGHSFEKIIDLRGEHRSETKIDVKNIFGEVPVVGLTDLFASVASNQKEMGERVVKVRREIEVLVQKKANAILIRPLGWDEICA